MPKPLLTVAACAALLPCAIGRPVFAAEPSTAPPQHGYSVETLRDPVFTPAEVVVQTVTINNWLADNLPKLTYAEMKGPREHLSYLIDSRVKQLYSEQGRILPGEPDAILMLLFSWSEQLGVYGGSHVFNAVRGPDDAPLDPVLTVPESLRLRLDGDLFAIQSRHGWSFSVPYYFMLWQLKDEFAMADGSGTMMLISTGATRDRTEHGHSQATLMFLFSPDADFETFREFWSGLHELPPDAQRKALHVRELESRYRFDEKLKLHFELTSWKWPSGSYAVSYSGIDGTYQWNRPHFLDFLRAIEENVEPDPIE